MKWKKNYCDAKLFFLAEFFYVPVFIMPTLLYENKLK